MKSSEFADFLEWAFSNDAPYQFDYEKGGKIRYFDLLANAANGFCTKPMDKVLKRTFDTWCESEGLKWRCRFTGYVEIVGGKAKMRFRVYKARMA